jgi:hypothetical protein
MKRSLIMLSVMVIFATGCSSTPKPIPLAKLPADAPAPVSRLEKKEAEFLKSNGSVKIEFDESGNFLGLASTGTAYIDSNHNSSRENAFNIALMRAKRNVSEFLSNDVGSNKFSKTITKTLMKNDGTDSIKSNRKEGSDGAETLDLLDDGGGNSETMSAEDRIRGQRVSTYVKEQMTDNSAALLRGLVITSRSIEKDSNLVSVEVRVTRNTVAASHSLRQMIEGLK